MKERQVGNVSMRCKGVRGFGSMLLRCELTQDGARGFGSALLRHELTQGGASNEGLLLCHGEDEQMYSS